MRRSLAILIVVLHAVVSAVAQVNICGTVVDGANTEPLAGASVMVKGADSKIKKFVSTKADGSFDMNLPSAVGCCLEVAMMGYAKRTLALDSVTFPLTVAMQPGTTQLKEVTVKAARIREQGDTISYNVGSFAQEQDRSIGDVLRRLPGISVESSGKIQYQGEDINKFYVEGSDLLGGKYGVATNGISHEDVRSVEVMENHQPMQVLSGIAFSDKAAINLKLKDKAKATWSLSGNASAGYSWQPTGAAWNGELFAMAVMPSFQHMSTLRTNNTGEELTAVDFFALQRGTDLQKYISKSLPAAPNLSARRTLFNRSALISTNNLWKLGRGEFKAQLDYSFNRAKAYESDVTTYFLSTGDRVVTENRSAKDRSHSLSGKFIYELNQKTAFVNNTLATNIDWDDVDLSVTGSLTNSQSISLPDYYVGNDFKLIQRFKGQHLVTFRSRNEWESMPQTLSVSTGDVNMNQRIKDHAFYTEESASYAFLLKGISISMEGGVKGYFRTMKSDLANSSDLPDTSDNLTNLVNTNYAIVYALPSLEYWVKSIDIKFNAPVSFATYHFHKALANRSEVYFSPSLSLNWKPSNRFSARLRGGLGRSPMSLNMIQPGFVMTNYRSFRRGVDDFYTTASQNLSASLSFKNSRRGLFANAYVSQSWSHVPYTMIQQLYGDYVVYSYSSARNNGQMFMGGADFGKTLDFIHGSANVHGSFSRQETHLLSEDRTVNSVGTSWTLGAKVNGKPLKWLGFDYMVDFASSRLAMNETRASWLGDLENVLLLNFVPGKKWEWNVSGEHYLNEITDNSYKSVLLLDTKLVYKLSKRLELSGSLTNILNRRSYNYKSYNQLTSFESRSRLRGREFLITISLRK
ncbi:MAG: TonB-dependent receptor [Muribaculaceae bacterium]|nr:TonB-dependent receptor [Muribaculaceae bacterium]